MKLFAIYITNNATAYGGAQTLCQVVLFVWLGNPLSPKKQTSYEKKKLPIKKSSQQYMRYEHIFIYWGQGVDI